MRKFLIGSLLLLLGNTAAQARWVSLQKSLRSDDGSRMGALVESEAIDGGVAIETRVFGMEVRKKQRKDRQFLNLEIPNQGYTNAWGSPKVPMVKTLVELESPDIEIKVDAGVQHGIENIGEINKLQVEPVQPPVVKLPGAYESAPFVIDTAAYQKDTFYPEKAASLTVVGKTRGRYFAILEMAPIQYNAYSQELRFKEKMRVEIRYKNPKFGHGKKSVPADDVFSTPSFDKWAKVNVVNFDPVQRWEREKLLILVGKGFETHTKLQEYILWKKQKGFEVVVKNVSELKDTTAKGIRKYVQKIYFNSKQQAPLAYVLLVGDLEQLDAYKEWHYTDNFYASLDEEEYSSDKTFPDIGVGRLPVQTAEELDTVLFKLLRYEQFQFKTTDWMKKISFLATDDRWELAEGTHNYAIDRYTKKNHFLGIFPEALQPGGDLLYAVTYKAGQKDVQKALDDGRLLVNYSGHGAYTFWDAPRVDKENIKATAHPEANAYFISNACISGSFGYWGGDSFGETIIKDLHGGIGFWGTTNNSYWDEDDILEKKFFDALFRDKIGSLSMANFSGMEGLKVFYNNGDRTSYYYEIYNLLGDPSLELWTQAPRDLGATVINKIDETREIVVNFNRTLKALGSLLDEKGNLVSMVPASASGVIRFENLEKDKLGQFVTVYVTATGAKPVIEKVWVIPPPPPPPPAPEPVVPPVSPQDPAQNPPPVEGGTPAIPVEGTPAIPPVGENPAPQVPEENLPVDIIVTPEHGEPGEPSQPSPPAEEGPISILPVDPIPVEQDPAPLPVDIIPIPPAPAEPVPQPPAETPSETPSGVIS